jgi:hypothetical protein
MMQPRMMIAGHVNTSPSPSVTTMTTKLMTSAAIAIDVDA